MNKYSFDHIYSWTKFGVHRNKDQVQAASVCNEKQETYWDTLYTFDDTMIRMI